MTTRGTPSGACSRSRPPLALPRVTLEAATRVRARTGDDRPRLSANCAKNETFARVRRGGGGISSVIGDDARPLDRRSLGLFLDVALVNGEKHR